ncbi:MAG TPA: PIG-L family deacetylase [Ktedonobacterales bacterium]
MSDLAILASYAHPDDEQGVTGTLAWYAERGVRTGLICATRGELGEIAEADPPLATPETLGQVREQEMRRAAEVAKIGQLWFLDYRDSGMRGTDGNQDAAAFMNVDEGEAVGKIVRVIRAFKPTVITTFDPTGGYGHPDHIRIQELTTKAFHAAKDAGQYPETGAAWEVKRLFYTSMPRSRIRQLAQFAREAGMASNFTGMDPEKLGLPDEMITNQIDVRAYLDLKRRSVTQHRTQMNPNSPFARLPEEITAQWRGTEYFALAAGTPVDRSDPAAAADLFAGLGA